MLLSEVPEAYSVNMGEFSIKHLSHLTVSLCVSFESPGSLFTVSYVTVEML